MKVLFGLWLRLLLVVLFVQVSWASPTTMYEKEPNNTPVEAAHFSGAMLLTGLLDKGDQDAYMWELDDENSQYLWDIELIGVPHAMTRIDIMKVTFTPDGKEVLDYKKFFSFGTRTGDKPIHLKHLLFDKGDYLIAVSSKSKNGTNTKHNYQINIIKDRKASKSNLEKRKNAPNISSTFYPYLFKENMGWFSFEIDKEERQKLWTLSGVTTIGHPLNVVLEDKAGHALFQTTVNKFGKFKLVDLELDEGKYYLKYSTDSEGTKNASTLYSTGAVKIESNEIEPNNDRDDANTISYRKTIHGKANKEGDYDYFSFKLPFKIEDKLFDLKLLSNDKDQKFYLKDREGHTLQEKSIDNNYTMTNLRLEPNKAYYISVYSYNKDGNYSFKFSNFKEAKLGEEVEPNDDVEHAYAIPLQEKIHGYL
ncbi:MAG: hypothetical protein FAF03_01755 [Epsilonproteobacteria bacterium]|nr:hypothetical protein [Campylobacterota bacterium]